MDIPPRRRREATRSRSFASSATTCSIASPRVEGGKKIGFELIDGRKQPTYDVVSALVQNDLDQYRLLRAYLNLFEASYVWPEEYRKVDAP